MQVWPLSQEDPLEEGMADLSSILAWRIPWSEIPDGLQSIGITKMDTTEVTYHKLIALRLNTKIV